ncbi:MAG: SufD family Fe-S cluster assembly protein [Acholeplasmatales bacterium]|nr:SufD family Fe-S cluster assembly protein [Acholeplasmatales bacterium]
MADRTIVLASSLGQGSIINKTEDVMYEINDSQEITIYEGVNAYILDNTKNKDVKINVLNGASVNYYVLNSNDSKRTFNVKGEINMIEINLAKTNEKINVSLLDENATFNAKVLSFSNKVKSQISFYADHLAQKTFSNIENVGVALNGGDLLFDVTGKIQKGMRASKASQISRGVIMDDESNITANPILLIDEYDCFANHGAAIGKINDEDLFYLMSRGLSKNEAFTLMLQGMIRPYIDSIPLESLKKQIEEKVLNLIER